MKEKKNQIIISLSPKLYPLEAIYGATYAFIDKAYIFLDGDPEKKIDVRLKLKPDAVFNFKNFQELKGEFLNELLNFSWRQQISKENRQLREYIVGAALLGATGETSLFRSDSYNDLPVEPVKVIGEGKIGAVRGAAKDKFDDPLGIAIPWEEKFAKQKSRQKNAKSCGRKK